MSERISIGLKSLKIGNIAVDGGMGTSLTALAGTFEDTATIIQEEGETTEFFIEESDDPIESLTKKGGTNIEWSIADMTPATLVKVLGGEVTGTGDAAKWNAPADVPSIEQSLEIISKKNIKYEFARVKIEARLDVNLSKKNVALVRVKAKVLTPTKAGVAPIVVSKVTT
jgi:hypothetical protein